MKAGIPERI